MPIGDDIVREREDRVRSLPPGDAEPRALEPPLVGDDGCEDDGSDESEFCGESTGGEVGAAVADDPACDREEFDEVDSVRWWEIGDFFDATEYRGKVKKK